MKSISLFLGFFAFLSFSAWGQPPTQPAVLLPAFDEVDTNGGGNISFGEFRDAFQSCHFFGDPLNPVFLCNPDGMTLKLFFNLVNTSNGNTLQRSEWEAFTGH